MRSSVARTSTIHRDNPVRGSMARETVGCPVLASPWSCSFNMLHLHQKVARVVGSCKELVRVRSKKSIASRLKASGRQVYCAMQDLAFRWRKACFLPNAACRVASTIHFSHANRLPDARKRSAFCAIKYIFWVALAIDHCSSCCVLYLSMGGRATLPSTGCFPPILKTRTTFRVIANLCFDRYLPYAW